ncbi:MAG: AMP-binding protein, partial [Chloroflexota bacterium]
MLTLIQKLYRIRLLTIRGLCYLIQSILTSGVNMMVLLRTAAKLHPDRIAITDDQAQFSYQQLYEQTNMLASILQDDYSLSSQQKVAIVCHSHAAAIKTIFAASRLGAHVYLLNPEMSQDQILALIDRFQFDLIVYDQQLATIFENSTFADRALPAYHASRDSVDTLSSYANKALQKTNLKKVETGNIVVLTGGTTGQPKSVSRKPSLFDFLPPFFALLTHVHLDKYQSIYIATPICHGYGLAMLFIAVIMGLEMHVAERFNAAQACSRVAQHNIQVMTAVPLILQRMLAHDAAALSSLRCIVAGSALLRPELAQEALERLGPTLFNLYGTSEAGFSIIATPETLKQKPSSIGQPVPGVQANMIDEQGQSVGEGNIGRLCIRSTWTADQDRWI